MARITAEQLKNVIDAVEFGDHQKLKTRSYSGRGMYGSQCLGFTCGSRQMLRAVAEIMATAESMNVDLDELAIMFAGVSWDSMGRDDVIIYFERIKAEGLDFSSDDEDGDDEEYE